MLAYPPHMKIARILDQATGQPLLVSADVERERVLDLRGAEEKRLLAQDASPKAARRLAGVLYSGSLTAPSNSAMSSAKLSPEQPPTLTHRLTSPWIPSPGWRPWTRQSCAIA